MKYIIFTHVDAKTGIPCSQEPIQNGPAMPNVKGIAFLFAMETQYPTFRPTFYGTCDDDGDVTVPGVIAEISPGQALSDCKAEWATRIRRRRQQAEVSGIEVGGMLIPTDDKTQARVDQIVKAYDDGDITGTIDFEAPDGFVTIDAAAIRAIKAAGAQHIQACFSNQRVLDEAAHATATIAEILAIDIDAGWPT